MPLDFSEVLFPLKHCKFAVIYNKENSEKKDFNMSISYIDTRSKLRS